NFAYDYEAYHEVKRNLGRLIGSGQLQLAMQLALELMKQGSCQVEMSDEGLMTPDIEDCLDVVLKALAKCDLRAAEVIAWCSAMRADDRVASIAGHPLQPPQNRPQAAAGRNPAASDTASARANRSTAFPPSRPPYAPRAIRSHAPPGIGGSSFAHVPEGHDSL